LGVVSVSLPQHPDEHRSEGPVLLAVDQQLGEGTRLGVAPELSDPVAAELSGTGIPLIMRAMDEGSGETARPQGPPSAVPGEASNPSAIASLLLGILAFAIQVWAWWYWVSADQTLDSPEFPVFLISSLVSLVAGISATVFGVKGRRRAKAEARGRVTAAIGLVLGIAFTVVSTFALLEPLLVIVFCLDDVCDL
jgi:hypothetical protein